MKATLPKCLLALAMLAATLESQAAILIDLEPSSQTINTGDLVSMDLVISGLGNFASPSLGAFDFDLSYNPAVLSATSLGFGNHLDLGILGSVQNSDLSTLGVIHLDEVSFESSSDLHANQPSSFTLATLKFTGAGSGVGSIDLTFGSLSDDTGQSSPSFQTKSAQVQVNGSGAIAVPDSGSSACLLAIGLLGVLVFRRTVFTADSDRKFATLVGS